MTTAILDALKIAAEEAERAEADFRREIAHRTKELERGRAHAYRRLNVMRQISEAVMSADDEEAAVAAARAALRSRLGWSSDDEKRLDVLAHFAPVARAMFASLSTVKESTVKEDEPKSDAVAALAEFETWYARTHPVSFWELFEHYMPETPLVDF